jgi:alpha-tubulin suppressor-like RCC1 family protein
MGRSIRIMKTGGIQGAGRRFPSQNSIAALLLLCALHWIAIVTAEAATVRAWGRNDYGQLNVPPSLTNVIAASAGYQHCVALNANGTLTAWGTGTNAAHTVPAGVSNVIAVSAGYYHNFALQADGTVVTWGAGETNSGAYPQLGQLLGPSNITGVASIVAGGYHNLVLLTNGTVMAWGDSRYGATNVPANLTNAVAIAAGGFHSLALRADGTVAAWGDNRYGQASVPASLTNVVAIGAGYLHSLAVRSDGTVVGWGLNAGDQVSIPASATNGIMVAGGWYHSIALKPDGTVIGWKESFVPEAIAPADLTNAISIECGFYMNLALVGDGSPTFAMQPAPRRVFVGTTTSFRALATSPQPMAYQWQYDGGDIPNETNAALTISSVQKPDAGHYRVVVSNELGVAVSSNALLTPIEQPSFFLAQPVSTHTYRHGNASFSASANGSPPWRFQWKFEGVDIPGATNATLNLTNVLASAAGNYSVAVSNDYGGAVSTNATLTVLNVVAWGQNSSGQSSVPVSLTNAIGIAAGQTHSLALQPDRTVVGWGDNAYGKATPPADATNIVSLVGGSRYSLGLKADGFVRGWGISWASNAPATLSNVTHIAGTLASTLGEHALAARADGALVGWGDPSYLYYALLPPPNGLSNIVGVAPGVAQNMVLREDGTVFLWAGGGPGFIGTSNAPPSATNIVATASGDFHFLALRDDGKVVAWGNSVANSLATNVPPTLSNVVAIAAGKTHNLALRKDGGVVAWGDSAQGKTTIPTGLTNVTAISAGENHSMALIGDGSPVIATKPVNKFAYTGTTIRFPALAVGRQPMSYQWQFNEGDLPAGTNEVLAISNLRPTSDGGYRVIVSNSVGVVTSAVAQLTVVVRAPFFTVHPANTSPAGDSAMLAANAFGSQPMSYQWFKGFNKVTNDARISGAQDASVVITNLLNGDSGWYRAQATNEDGSAFSQFALLLAGPRSVAHWGSTTFNKAQVPADLTNVVALTAGAEHCLALRTDGSAGGWGNNNAGQTTIPAAATNLVAVAAKGTHSLGLKANGTVLSWGQAYTGFPSLSGIVAIAAGQNHGLALRSNGTVVAWGSSSVQTNVPAGLADVIAIQSGNNHSLALKRDGTVVAWGDNTSGQTNVPASASNVVSIAGGGVHSLALRRDGTVVGWGGSGNGAVPSGLSNVVAITAGNDFSLAAKGDGTLAFWGASGSATQQPPGLSNVLNVAAGSGFSLALVGDSAPVIFSQPVSRTVSAGSSTTFTLFASGSQPFSYQWQHAGTNLVGESNASLTLTNIPVLAAGNYACLVSNTLGNTLSSNATLTVTRSPILFTATTDSLLLTNGGFQMQITGMAGAGNVTVYASTNLADWTPVFTNPPHVGTLFFLDESAGDFPARFYRAAEEP